MRRNPWGSPAPLHYNMGYAHQANGSIGLGYQPPAPVGVDTNKLCLPTDYFFHALLPVFGSALAPFVGTSPNAITQLASGLHAVAWYWYNQGFPCCPDLVVNGNTDRSAVAFAAAQKLAKMIGYDDASISAAHEQISTMLPPPGLSCPPVRR